MMPRQPCKCQSNPSCRTGKGWSDYIGKFWKGGRLSHELAVEYQSRENIMSRVTGLM